MCFLGNDMVVNVISTTSSMYVVITCPYAGGLGLCWVETLYTVQ